MTEPAEVWRRFTARVLPVNSAGQVLLLKGFDPCRPETQYWFTIGGAVEDGETLEEAGVLELYEEVGIIATADALTRIGEVETVRFSFNGWDIMQDQTYFTVFVGEAEVSLAHLEGLERATTVAYRWWTPGELQSSGDPFHPPLLAAMRRARRVPR